MKATDLELARRANRYTTVCNLVEALWQKRLEKDFWNIDLDNLPLLTSPEARRIASFINDLYDDHGPLESIHLVEAREAKQKKDSK